MEDIEFISPFEELDNGCNLEDGIIYLNGEIQRGTLFILMAKMRACLKAKKQDLTLIINSEGGDEFETLAIIDFIESLNVKVNIIARGVCMSAAAILICYATGLRAASKRTIFMLHPGFYTHEGGLYSMKSFHDISQKVEKDMYKELSLKTKISEKEWFDLNHDKYFTAFEAMEMGIINRII